ncbi:unnamed protein product, partial [Urochloa humidicola]
DVAPEDPKHWSLQKTSTMGMGTREHEREASPLHLTKSQTWRALLGESVRGILEEKTRKLKGWLEPFLERL